jgi:hypothetical protein
VLPTKRRPSSQRQQRAQQKRQGFFKTNRNTILQPAENAKTPPLQRRYGQTELDELNDLLHDEAESGCIETAEQLLNDGAELEGRNETGYTPLHGNDGVASGEGGGFRKRS